MNNRASGAHALTRPLPADGGGDDAQHARQNILRVLSVFRRRWYVPAVTAAAAVTLLLVYSLVRPPQYRAYGMVQLGMYQAMNADQRERVFLQGSLFETHHRLLTSHSVVEDAIRRTGRELVQGPGRREQREVFLEGITLEPVRNTFLVQVEAIGSDPQDVVARVNALMDAFIPFTNEFLGSRFVVRERQLKDKELVVLKQLRDAEERQRQFYERAGSINFLEQRATLLRSQEALHTRLTSLKIDRALAAADREKLKRRLEELQKATEVELLAASFEENPAISERRRRIGELKARLGQLEANMAPERLAELPEYGELKARLDFERRALRAELIELTRAGQATAEERESGVGTSLSKLDEQLEEAKAELGRLDRLEGQFRTIRREVEWYDRELEDTRGELRRLQSMLKQDVSGAMIVNRAEVPSAPEPRLKTLATAFVALLAFGLGVFLIVAWDHLDDTVSRDEDAGHFGLPILGQVPHLDFREVDELAHTRGSFWTAEAFGLIRTNISVTAGSINKAAILVTSGSPRDGKSFVSLNLAASFARTGGRTLIIEADMRRPRVQAILGTEHKEGLSDALADQRPLEELVKPTEFAGLDLLPAGACPLNPADLLIRGQFERVVAEAIKRYDHVVIDAPPARPLADTSLMAPFVQGVVYVVRLRSSRRSLIQGAVDQVNAVGGKSLGVIVNDVTVREEPSLHYVSYGAYYDPRAEGAPEGAVPAAEGAEGDQPVLFLLAPPKDELTPTEQRGRRWALVLGLIVVILGGFVIGGQSGLLPGALQEAYDGLGAGPTPTPFVPLAEPGSDSPR